MTPDDGLPGDARGDGTLTDRTGPGAGVTPLAQRQPGPDVVRAVAMLGVIVMNYHGYLIIKGGDPGDGSLASLFDPWTGPLSTRFAATFVLVAGVGVTLLTASAAGDPARTTSLRWLLARRGVVLYAFGFAFDFIWSGTILPFYGAMFVLAAGLCTLSSRWVLLVGVAAAAAAWWIRAWRYDREIEGVDTSWLTSPSDRSIRGLVLDVWVNGTHPLLPWLCFFCVGIVLGRVLATTWWRQAAIGGGLMMWAVATLVERGADGERATVLLSTDPFERGGMYVLSTLGTALVAFAGITWLADRAPTNPVVDVLRRAGQLSLTLYVLHALVFNLVVDWLDWIQPGGLGTALTFAVVVWITGLGAAVAWQRRFGRGPAEQLYRALTA